MDNIVDVIFACSIAVSIEETGREVGAGIDCESHACHVVVVLWSSLRPANRALHIAIANAELVVVLRKRLEPRSLHFNRVVDIRGSVRLALGYNFAQVFVRGYHVRQAHRVAARSDILLVVMVVEWHSPLHRDIAFVIVDVRAGSRPEDDGLRVGITRSHAVGKVQHAGIHVCRTCLSPHDLGHGDAECRVVVGGAAIVEVAAPVCFGSDCERCEGQGESHAAR